MKKIHRWAAFAGEIYYPAGTSDFVGTYATKEEASAAALKEQGGETRDLNYRWAEVLDLATGERETIE